MSSGDCWGPGTVRSRAPWVMVTWEHSPHPVGRMTDRTENITFPHGGGYTNDSRIRIQSFKLCRTEIRSEIMS